MIAAPGAQYLGHCCECRNRKFLQGQEVVKQQLAEIPLNSGAVSINIRYLQVIVFSPFY